MVNAESLFHLDSHRDSKVFSLHSLYVVRQEIHIT